MSLEKIESQLDSYKCKEEHFELLQEYKKEAEKKIEALQERLSTAEELL